jgi:DNA-directed RNA polymerase subunit H (RpoH/RPB5)
MHKRSGAKIFTIVEDAVIAYTKAKDPEVLKIVRKCK